MPKELKTIAELEAMINAEFAEPSVIVNVHPDEALGWEAKAHIRARGAAGAAGAEMRVKQITQRLREMYDLKG